MDTRRLLTTVVIVGALMIAYPYISKLWMNPKPAAPIIPTTVSAGLVQGLPYPATAPKPLGSEDGATPEQVTLGDPKSTSKDKVAVTINNVTADIDEVQLNVNDYTEFAKGKGNPVKPLTLMKYHTGEPRPYATLNVRYTFPDGSTGEGDFIGSQYVWKIEPNHGNHYEARLRATLNYKGVPTLEITKIFRVDPKSYEVYISHEVRNLTKKPLKVQINQMAALDMPLDTAQLDDRFYHAAGLNSGKQIIDADRFNMSHTELKKWTGNTKEVGSFLGKDPLEWIASSGRFFVAITRPLPESNSPGMVTLYGGHKIPVVNHIASANLDRLIDDANVGKSLTAIRLTGNAVEVPAGATESLPLSVYFGPKRQDILQGNYQAPVGSLAYDYAVFEYSKIIQLVSSSCFGIYKFCFVETLAYYMLWALDLLKASVAFGNYGVAIIMLVIFIKAAMHPLTRKSQVNMAVMGKKMKDIQPLIEANKKKYATDKAKQNEEMMRIYKEKKVNPAGGIMGCLPMMLQTPIWIAVWEGLRSDIALRHAVFIPGWINDLSAPDATIVFAHPVTIPVISMLMGPIPSLNILPLLLAVVMFFQMRVQSASQPRSADPQQAQMQKMSQYMVLIFPLFLYGMPSGINLYYFASTLGGLVDTYYVRKSLKKKGILPTNAPVLPTHEEPVSS